MNDQTMFDLSGASERSDGEYIVKHPVTGEPTAARLTLAGPEHEVRRSVVFGRMRARRAELESTGKLALTDPVDDDANNTAFIASCTLGWSGLAIDGKALPFEIGAAQKLFSDPRFRWLRDQAFAALDKRELFIGASATV